MINLRKLPVLANRLGLLLLFSVFGLTACSTTPPDGMTPVTPFDLTRYEGKWYEVARLDHSFERGLTDVSATYQAKPMAVSRSSTVATTPSARNGRRPSGAPCSPATRSEHRSKCRSLGRSTAATTSLPWINKITAGLWSSGRIATTCGFLCGIRNCPRRCGRNCWRRQKRRDWRSIN
jgi:hypothetical protein